MTRRGAGWCVALGLALCAWTAPARAQETWLVSGDALFAMPVGGWQADDFGPGGSLGLSVHRSLAPWLLFGVRLDGVLLLDGGKVGNGRADLGPGTLWGLGPALRLRPFGRASDPARGTGLYLEGVASGVFTGSKTMRFGVEAAIGYGFAWGDVDLGPTVRFAQVIQTSDPVDDSDARLLLLGLSLAFIDGRAKPPAPPPKAAPPADRDHDGIVDTDDACPDEPEDKDGFDDADGCPDRDNDKDGIADVDDRCPNDAEDKDGFEDEDGCPEPDNDHDGILDESDQCPTEAEVINGVDDTDGCPDEGLIEMKDDRIVLEETVLFDFERARVKSSATPVLRAIMRLWKQHEGEWTHLRIEGHSDARGDAAFNDDLSRRRAEHVRDALAKEGIPAEIMDAEGFGSRKLRDLGTTEVAHQRNRRVEFVVTAKRPAAPTEAP